MSRALAVARRTADTLVRAGSRWLECEAPRLAASLAFWALFSLLPLLVLALAVLEAAVADSAAFRRQALDAVDATGSPAVRSLLEEALRAATAQDGARVGVLGGALVGLVGASGVFAELHHALDRMFGQEGTTATLREALRKYLARRLFAFLLVGATALLVLAAAVFATVWDAVSLGSTMLRSASGLGSIGVLALAVALCLSWVPERSPGFRRSLLGGLTASLLLHAVRPPFGALVLLLPQYTASGVVGSVLAVVAWLYVASLVLLFGAAVAAES